MVRAPPTCSDTSSRHHTTYATAHRRNRVFILAAIIQPSASRNLSQNHLSCKFTQFAVESIRRWWNTMGAKTYPDANRLLITADSGGSNGSRLRL